jgi:hypothetical protein
MSTEGCKAFINLASGGFPNRVDAEKHLTLLKSELGCNVVDDEFKPGEGGTWWYATFRCNGVNCLADNLASKKSSLAISDMVAIGNCPKYK